MYSQKKQREWILHPFQDLSLKDCYKSNYGFGEVSGGEELFFDEFVYLWSVEVYICTDVRNSCYLQNCASFT